jgi:hypothetical protein
MSGTPFVIKRSTSDTNMYSVNHPIHGIYVALVFVNDILGVSDSLHWVSTAKAHIRQQFNMTDFGPTTYTLGMDITRERPDGTVRMSQEQYNIELLEK